MTRPALILVLAACGGAADAPPALEIGVRHGTGAMRTFTAIHDGDDVPVVFGPNALNMVVPSLRAAGINPRGPVPKVTLTVGDKVLAANIATDPVDMTGDSEMAGASVLWDLRTPFQAFACCYVCGEGVIDASLTDGSGRTYTGHARIRLKRGTCPDLAACCEPGVTCPVQTTAPECAPVNIGTRASDGSAHMFADCDHEHAERGECEPVEIASDASGAASLDLAVSYGPVPPGPTLTMDVLRGPHKVGTAQVDASRTEGSDVVFDVHVPLSVPACCLACEPSLRLAATLLDSLHDTFVGAVNVKPSLAGVDCCDPVTRKGCP